MKRTAANPRTANKDIEVQLTARDVEEALEERISTRHYRSGDRLPPVRDIAAEFGTSPSTVSRALQQMMRSGLLEVFERRFVRVKGQLPAYTARSADVQRSIRAIAHKWKLKGGSENDLLAAVRETVSDIYRLQAKYVFTECNTRDLEDMAGQLEEELPGIGIQKSLIADLDGKSLEKNSSVVLVPYYHYTEVKRKVGDKASVVPIHFSPEVSAFDRIISLKPDSDVFVIGANARSVDRISLMVRQCIDARISSATLDEIEKIRRNTRSAHAVIAVSTAIDKFPELRKLSNLIEVRFVLDAAVKLKLINGR